MAIYERIGTLYQKKPPNPFEKLIRKIIERLLVALSCVILYAVIALTLDALF